MKQIFLPENILALKHIRNTWYKRKSNDPRTKPSHAGYRHVSLVIFTNTEWRHASITGAIASVAVTIGR